MSKNFTKVFQLLFFVATLFPLSIFAQTDMGAIGLVAPAQQGCYGSAQTVTVRIKNYSAGTHNFATTPVTVNASVSGPNAISFPAVLVNTGTLIAGDSMNVTIVSNYNMTATGVYVFSANTSFAGDVNTANNTMSPTTINVQPLAAGTISASPAAYCGTGGSPTLTLSGGAGGTIQWQESATGVAGSWVNVGANAATYTPATAINATRYYRAYKTCNGNADTSATLIVPFSNPQVLTTTPGAVCGPGTVTLGATTTPGDSIYWSTSPNWGWQMGMGNSYITPSLTTTTNFYAFALNSIGTVDVGIKVSDFPVCGNPLSSTLFDQPLRFTTTRPLTINSVYVIPSTSNLAIALRQQGMYTNILIINLTFTAAQIGQPQLVPLGFFIPVPGNYQLTNTTGGLWRIPSPSCSYPFVSPLGGLLITGSGTSSSGPNSTTIYNSFYQLNINEGCISAPVPVVAQVNSPASIIQQPMNVSTCQGSTVNLIVGAQGTGLNYQWKKNGVNVANSNNDTLAFSPVTVGDAGNYEVIITGACGSPITSSTVTMTVASTCAWSGAESNEWNRAGNWSGGLPTSGSNIIIPSGTPFQPLISSGIWDVKSVTISSGASLTMNSGSGLNIYGDFVNNGTFNAAGASVYFKGTAMQNIGSMTAGNVVVNGSGITLNGAMTVNQSLTLTYGNIILGMNNLTINGSANGSVASHVVVNSTGGVVAKNISNTAFTVPVGPSSSSYNPVTINNGGGRDYLVNVVTGLSVPIANPAIAVNRTWTVLPSTSPASPANITLQFEDGHMNAMGQPSSSMDAGVHDGSYWDLAGMNVVPSGSSSGRQVSFNTSKFGPMAVANRNGIVNYLSVPATLDPAISSLKLIPALVESSAVLKVVSTRAVKIKWNVTDAHGRIVLRFDQSLHQGQNDIQLRLQQLAPGIYSLNGVTEKGNTEVVRFVKQ